MIYVDTWTIAFELPLIIKFEIYWDSIENDLEYVVFHSDRFNQDMLYLNSLRPIKINLI